MVESQKSVILEPDCELYCKCIFDDDDSVSSEQSVVITSQKRKILTSVDRTENYLQKRRIPELIRFLLTKIIAERPEKPIAYLEELLVNCMLFRAGYGTAPVLYEDRHLEAVIKSFDPGQRGWLSIEQVSRLYATLGFTLLEVTDGNFTIPTDIVFEDLKKVQESELLALLSGVLRMDDMSEKTSAT